MLPRDVHALPRDAATLRSAPKPRIVNVVATCEFAGTPLDGESLTQQLPGVCYNPARFAAVKVRSVHAVTLAFCGGKAVCPGNSSVAAARNTALDYVLTLLELGYTSHDVAYRNFRVQNIVCHCATGFEVDLQALADAYTVAVDYNPSAFPGLTYRVPRHLHASRRARSEIVFNVFVSGNVIITGARTYALSRACWAWFYHAVLCHFALDADGAGHGAVAGTSSAVYRRRAAAAAYAALDEDCDTLASARWRATAPPALVWTADDAAAAHAWPRARAENAARLHALRCGGAAAAGPRFVVPPFAERGAV